MEPMNGWIYITLHVRFVWPSIISHQQQFTALDSCYRSIGVQVRLGSLEPLNARQPVNLSQFYDIDAGQCDLNGSVAPQLAALHAYRAGIPPAEPIAYFVRSVGRYDACASHFPMVPAFVIGSNASLYTMAHELGHVLGLSHENDSDNLMYEYGTGNITNLPPDLTDAQRITISQSPFVQVNSMEMDRVRMLLQRDLPNAEIAEKLSMKSRPILKELAVSSDPSIAAKAIHAASVLNTNLGKQLAKKFLNDPREIVRHTASIVLGEGARSKKRIFKPTSAKRGNEKRAAKIG
jgi:hypothetical protein